jgi:hypothetical protein
MCFDFLRAVYAFPCACIFIGLAGCLSHVVKFLFASCVCDLPLIASYAVSTAHCMCHPQQGETPLMGAAEKGRTDCVRLLVEGGANIEAKNKVCDVAIRPRII